MHSTFRLLVLVSILLLASQVCLAQQLTLTPLKATGIYAVGEKVGWEVQVRDSNATPVKEAAYTLKRNGLTVYKEGTLDLASGKASIETSLDAPGAVLLEISTADGGRGRGFGQGRTLAGAMVAPEKLQPSRPRPEDFDAWWDAKIKQLNVIPANPQLEPNESGKPNVDYFTIRMDNINGTHIYGQLAKPKGDGKYPALLQLQWAGVYGLQKPWVIDRAAKGWLAMNVEPHDLPGNQPAAFYQNATRTLGTYYTQGNTDRETSYFLRMYLSAYRALDYLSSRSDWDGKTLVVFGDSMGGQQSVVMAGLHPKVTAMMALVPSSCDMAGPRNGRAAGFPDWEKEAANKKNDKILEVGSYFDPVNFASRIKCPSLISMGFIDETCPPTGVWSAVNQIKVPKEVLPLIDSPHQDRPPGVQRPHQVRREEWLAAMVKGEPAPIKSN
jgi:cephalosporin-C deacetylase-like acetyl esterase